MEQDNALVWNPILHQYLINAPHRMHRREDDVTGFGRGHRDLHRFAIANFADQNYFRRLPKRGAQAIGKIGKIFSKLTLVEEVLLMWV